MVFSYSFSTSCVLKQKRLNIQPHSAGPHINIVHGDEDHFSTSPWLRHNQYARAYTNGWGNYLPVVVICGDKGVRGVLS